MLVVVCWSLCATAHCVCARNLCKLVHAAGGVRVSLGLVLSRRFVLWWLNSATDVQLYCGSCTCEGFSVHH